MGEPGLIEHHLTRTARSVHRELLAGSEAEALASIDPARVRRLAERAAPLCTEAEIDRVVGLVDEQLHGLGPLDPLLRDDTVTEIMVNGVGPVWIERAGAVVPTSIVLDADDLRLVIDRAVSAADVRLDRLLPFADARLSDGSRVHIVIEPMAVTGPYVTIRRFGTRPIELEEFAEASVVALLHAAVRRRHNVLVSGATSAGKTSLLNALAGTIPEVERIITIEDAAELQLPGPHIVRLEARPPTAEGFGELTIRTLTRNALRMRPDRLVIGEVRGAEAFDMVQALRTGHDGCLVTCHADGPRDALSRIATLALMSEVALPAQVLLDQAWTAFDLVVHVERAHGGRRRVTSVLATGRGGSDKAPGDELLVADGSVTPVGRRWLDLGDVDV